MRNGLALPLLFAASVATSVMVTRLITAASNGSGEALQGQHHAAAMPTGEVPLTPAVSQRASTPLAVGPPSPPIPLTSAAHNEPVGPGEPPRVDLEKALFEAEQKFENDSPADRRAADVKSDMNDAFSRSLADGAALDSLECKLKTCRGVLTSTTSDVRERSLNKLGDDDKGPFAKYGFVVRSRETMPDGRSRATIFVDLP